MSKLADLEAPVCDVLCALDVVRTIHDDFLDLKDAERTGGFYQFTLSKQQTETFAYVIIDACRKAGELHDAFFKAVKDGGAA